jgi:deoxyribodipyrimidine photo-lyase
MVKKLCERAALLVTDDFPTFVVPAHNAAMAKHARCPVVSFDDNTVVPLSLLPKEEFAARTIRPKVHRLLPTWFRPIEEPDAQVAPDAIVKMLPFVPFDVEQADLDAAVAELPIDHAVKRAEGYVGGAKAAEKRLASFLRDKLAAYPDDHNHPDRDASSRLSPYLHFGQIGARGVALAVRAAAERRPAEKGAVDGFLEQLLVRRTLSYNLAATNPRHQSLAALPDWPKKTLAEHENDPRGHLYTRVQLERAETDDQLWNAAQRELVATGVIHNYARMLWGKCVIPWKQTNEEAFADLVYLNDKYALDGRDPNTYTSILWCFGKHDRPWGPARPVFGTVRYMSTTNARKKLDLERWLARWTGSGAGTQGRLF